MKTKEDIFEKDSSESYFIQICDFIAYFTNLYYKVNVLHKQLPNRVSRLIDNEFVLNTMKYFKKKEVFNNKLARNSLPLQVVG